MKINFTENFFKRTWAQINLDCIDYNFKSIKSKLKKDTKILCVLKADAYGHGAEFLVKEYERLGADYFGVSNIDEALQLRKSGATKPILIFGYTPPEMAPIMSCHNISQAVFSIRYAKELEEICIKKGITLSIHIKIDSGMSRIGFFCQNKQGLDESESEIFAISRMRSLRLDGIFTHFSVSDDITQNKKYTLFQYENFIEIINRLKNLGIDIPLKHCCNSGAILNFPEMQLDMVRAGVILYGLYPSAETKNKIHLKPTMELKSVISQIKTVPANTSLSYGRKFISDKEMKIASVTIGYADGYSLKFSGNSEVLVCGKRAPVLGRVCMDQLMIDVSDIEDAHEKSEVTIFGKSKNAFLSVDELAEKIGTINYEIVCLIGKRVPRIYSRGNAIEGKVIYL